MVGGLGQPVGVGPVRIEGHGQAVLNASQEPLRGRPCFQCPGHRRGQHVAQMRMTVPGVLGDPVGPRALRRGILPRCSGLWAVHVEHHGPNQRRGVGVDVGTFEGLLAWVVLDAGSQFIGAGQPFWKAGLKQGGLVGW
ncbi:hypothetical protein AN643_00720 [Candidatus Epulonipiscioides saccharophilum]|nr:hypothetical protein AN643_00720 [Epulopiscium sp. SCG-B10WGA-EpuloB]